MGNLNRKLDMLCSIKASFQLSGTLQSEQSENLEKEKFETERHREHTPIKAKPKRDLSHSSQKTLKKSDSVKRKMSISPIKTLQQKQVDKQSSAIKQMTQKKKKEEEEVELEEVPFLRMEAMPNEQRKSFLEMKTLEIESNVAEGRPTLQKILAERRKKRDEEEGDYEQRLDDQREAIIKRMHEKFAE